MAIGIIEVSIIVVVGLFVYFGISSKAIPKKKLDHIRKQVKETLKDVKEVEYDFRETIDEVEQEVKRKKKKKSPKRSRKRVKKNVADKSNAKVSKTNAEVENNPSISNDIPN